MRDIIAMSAIFAILPVMGGIFLAACPPQGPVVAPTDAADANVEAAPAEATVNDCQAACDAITRAGCKTLHDCAKVLCQINIDPRFHHYDLGCLERAQTPTEVIACGADCAIPKEGGR